MRKTLYLSMLLFIMMVTFINCGEEPEVEIPPYNPPSEKPIVTFCGTGKSYLDLPSPLLLKLKELANNKKGGLIGTSVNQYESGNNTYFELKIGYSSYDIDGLYTCNGENLMSDNINDRETPASSKYRANKKFVQTVWMNVK